MKQVYLNEFNIEAGKSIFLPYSCGLIQSYVQQNPTIKQNYNFNPIFFRKDTVQSIIDQYNNPDIIGFSTVIWNYRISLAVAKALKEKFPACVIVFGGPNVTTDKNFFTEHPYVDLVVYGEGEKIFEQILLDRLENKLPRHVVLSDFTFNKDLDIFPSPYTTGIYDKIIDENTDIEFKVLVEMNRNCPFGCTFCFWGQPELGSRMKYHSPEYIQQEAEWIGKHKIDYVFCTDANFGMYKRDIETAKIYAKIKQQYKYPEKFRVCYGKNATQHIFETAKILNQAQMDKLITLSVQSTNPDTLKAVNRKNISTDAFKRLQKQYIENNIATYTEFILGLPLETKQSFYHGLEETLQLIGRNQIFVYPCQILPNTDLNTPEHREKYGLITKTVPMRVPHSNPVNENVKQEQDEIVVATNTMSIEDMIECNIMAWTVQLFHSFNVGYDIVNHLHKTYDLPYMTIYSWVADSNIDEICELRAHAQLVSCGEHWSMTYPEFGNIYYEPEEMMYLRILYNPDKFYNQLYNTLLPHLHTDTRTIMKLRNVIQQNKDQLPNTDNVQDWVEFAINTVVKGGKDNNQ